MVISNTEPSTHSSFLHSCKNTQNLSSRPIISGCDSPTERISAFVDSLLQPIMKEQQSYIKDTTQFINFIAGTRVPQNAILGCYKLIYKYTARRRYHDHIYSIYLCANFSGKCLQTIVSSSACNVLKFFRH